MIIKTDYHLFKDAVADRLDLGDVGRNEELLQVGEVAGTSIRVQQLVVQCRFA
jgi:hypothetical protein